jgi:SNF2 family DNA or RNA helicase
MVDEMDSKNSILSFLVAKYIASKNHHFFVSTGNNKIEYSHYQYRPLAKLLNENINGLLIADDVGIGKTIETGIIIKELMHKDNIKHVLILCPSELINK